MGLCQSWISSVGWCARGTADSTPWEQMGWVLCGIRFPPRLFWMEWEKKATFALGLAKVGLGSSAARACWAVVEESAQTAAEARVINTEIGGQGCSALPEQAPRVRLELSQKAAQGSG